MHPTGVVPCLDGAPIALAVANNDYAAFIKSKSAGNVRTTGRLPSNIQDVICRDIHDAMLFCHNRLLGKSGRTEHHDENRRKAKKSISHHAPMMIEPLPVGNRSAVDQS